MTRHEGEQGRLFGEVADTYDRVRPGYPPEAIAELVARGGDGDVLELGSGTGKLTRLLAPRARRIVAVEPDPDMVAVARHRMEEHFHAEWVVRAFEDWQPPEAAFDLVVCAQAWHWLDPATRLARAARGLAPGGCLALLWNRPAPLDDGLGAELDAAYERHAPEIAARTVCAAPSSRAQPTAEEELAASRLLRPPVSRSFEHTARYTTGEHRELLATMSDCRLLAPDRRQRLIDEVSAAIDAHGGLLEVRYACRVVVAQRLPARPAG